MEHLYPLLILCSGATIVLLGSFLLASERELKKKRREIDEFKRKRTADSDTSTDGRHSEMRSSEAIGKNDELLQEISALSSRLEESEKTLAERQNDHRLWLSAPSENRQLQEKIDNLKIRLQTSENQLAESTKGINEGFDLNTKLQIENTGLKQRLAEKDEALVALQSGAADAARLESENREFAFEKESLLEEIATLGGQLQTHEARLSGISSQYEEIVERHAHLQTCFAQSERQTADLTAKNKELQKEVDMSSSKLAAAEKSIEQFRMLQHTAHLDDQRLLETHQQLKREIGMMHEQLETLQSQLDESARRNQEAAEWNEKLQIDLSDQRQAAVKELQDAERRVQEAHANYRTQLDTMENRFQESVRQYHELSDRCVRLEAEADDYRQQLERSQSIARESDAAQEQGANVESREASYQEQQQKLEALIGDLERELSEGKSQVEALEETHQRLRETERICLELGDENRRLGEDIARWQQRLAESEENQRQVTLLRQQIDALQTEHARVIDNNRRMQVDLAADGEAIRVSSPVESDSDGATIIQSKIQGVAGSSSDLTGSDQARGHPLGSSSSAQGHHEAQEASAGQIIWRSIARNWHFGAVFASVVIVVIAAAVAMKIPATEVSISREPVVLAPEATPVEPTPEPAAKPPIKVKAAPRLRGAFQTVRPTQVFSGPSESSALIANIGQGMKLNVVDSKDGWLEIRSKHGRPPGFVRQEAAVRIGSN